MNSVSNWLYIQASRVYFFRPCETGELKHQTFSLLLPKRDLCIVRKGGFFLQKRNRENTETKVSEITEKQRE
jgi:hypothetical protein